MSGLRKDHCVYRLPRCPDLGVPIFVQRISPERPTCRKVSFLFFINFSYFGSCVSRQHCGIHAWQQQEWNVHKLQNKSTQRNSPRNTHILLFAVRPAECHFMKNFSTFLHLDSQLIRFILFRTKAMCFKVLHTTIFPESTINDHFRTDLISPYHCFKNKKNIGEMLFIP